MSSTVMHIRMPEELRARLRAVAQGRNMTAMILDAVIQWLAQEERRLKP